MRRLVITIAAAMTLLAVSAGADAPREAPPARIFNSPMAPFAFSLVDHDGRPFTAESLKAQWTLLFFGYTSCADVCPTTLTALNGTYKRLANDASAPPTRVVFVSVDPHRDSLERLREHLHFFNAAFLGVTGPLADLQRLALSLGAPFDYRDRTTHKIIDRIEARPIDDDYIVSHMSELFVFNPDGKLAGLIFPPYEPERIVADLRAIQARPRPTPAKD